MRFAVEVRSVGVARVVDGLVVSPPSWLACRRLVNLSATAVC